MAVPKAAATFLKRFVGTRGAKAAGEVVSQGGAGMRVAEALRNPMLAVPAGVAGAGFGYEALFEPVQGNVMDVVEGRDRRLAREKFERQERMRARAEALRLQQLERDVARAAARLAAVDPQLYQEVMAGRQLPQGAVVLGGRPRVDLMEQLAYDLATGGQAPSDPEDELMQILQGRAQ